MRLITSYILLLHIFSLVCWSANLASLVGVLVGMIIPIFVWRPPKGHCYGNQLNLGDVCRHCQERPLLFALAFDNGLADCEVTFKR